MRISAWSSDACSSDLRVIGRLLGVPEADQAAVRDGIDAKLRTEAGKPLEVEEGFVTDRGQFDDYIDWRAEHPSDDIMTDLLNVEFEDEPGTVRRLAGEELIIYISVIAGGGNGTTKSEERRVGKEWCSRGRSRGSADN